MSKATDTIKRFEESLDLEATRIQEAIAAAKEEVRSDVDGYFSFVESKDKYVELIRTKLEKAGVEKFDDLEDDEKKKEMEEEVDKEFEDDAEEGDKELEEAVRSKLWGEVIVPDFKSDEPTEFTEPASKNKDADDVVKNVEKEVKGDGEKEPVIKDEKDEEKEEQVKKAKVDDQTDVAVEEPKTNSGEKDTSGDPLKK